MKPSSASRVIKSATVAPLAGAWIETIAVWRHIMADCRSRPSRARGLKLESLHAGDPLVLSRPSRARGLKHLIPTYHYGARHVAPLAGAWIETRRRGRSALTVGSRPSRARGLKPLYPRERQTHILVAPLAGAWIETMMRIAIAICGSVAPLAGAWIETMMIITITNNVNCRAPRGRVD